MRIIWVVSNAWRAYQQMLIRRPMCTHAVTSGTLFTIGDLLAQRIEHPRCSMETSASPSLIVAQADNNNVNSRSRAFQGVPSGSCWDLSRTFRLLLFGSTMSGPVAFAWYRLMEKAFPQRTLRGTLSKIITHTFAYAPAHLSTFCAWMGFSEGLFTKALADVPQQKLSSSLKDCQQLAFHRTKQNAPKLWLAGCAFWIPVVLFNYAFIPLEKRVLVNNCCNLIWTCFLSLQANKKNQNVAAANHHEP